MSEKIKKIIKKIVPVSARRFIASYRYGFFGPYASWQSAKDKSTGYDSDLILNKVKDALLKVKRGEVAYERDSVIFDEAEYSWPILSILLFIAGGNSNNLNVIDFGGSLGSTYFQHRKFLSHLKELKWSIVEQPNFVACGKENFTDKYLRFYGSITDCLTYEQPLVIIFSSVIEYLEKPYDILTEMMAAGFEYIIFDRTTFLQNGEDMVTLQRVPPQVYTASYPCWFLNKEKLLAYLSPKYELLADFPALGGSINQGNIKGEYRGLFFKLKK
jgi:putative methyltransferase (TIGR04325 family)